MSLKHGFESAIADSADDTKLRPSNWGSEETDYETAPTHVFHGGATGSVLYRDEVAVDGKSWLAASQGVLMGSGAGVAPAYTMSPSLTAITLATALTPANGGTGVASYAVGDLLYASGATTLAKLASVAVGSVLVSGGVGAAPAWSATPTLASITLTPGANAGAIAALSAITNTDNIDGILITSVTSATSNGAYGLFGVSSQMTSMTVSAGVTDTGQRVAITGDAYAAIAGFAGTLTNQAGVRGRAGFTSAVAATAVVTNAYGGYFEIQCGKAGATITNGYGVYVNNVEAVGTMTNRWDLYCASSNAKNYFAGKVGIGIAPSYSLDIAVSGSNARGLNIDHSGTGSSAIGGLAVVYGAGGINYGFRAIVTGAGANYSFYGDNGVLFNADSLGVGVTAFGTSAAKVIGIGNGTEPGSSPADMVQLYSVDLSAGNATLGLRTETAVVSEAVVSDRTLSIRINGTTYKICLKS